MDDNMNRLANLTMIVAQTEDGGIGSDNSLPWKCKEDMKFFKRFTTGKNVVMGYNTLASLDFKPLPNRKNFMLKGRGDNIHNGVFINDMPCMLQIIKTKSDEKFVIIGGTKTYEAFMPYISKAYITTIKDVCVNEGVKIDTYMPAIPEKHALQGVIHGDNTCTVRCYTCF
jgi:dihydrofolate reductase